MSLQGSLSIERMCQLVPVSRRGFYRSLKEQQPAEEEMEVRSAIQQIALEHRRRYGYRRITAELHRRGMPVNHKRVARIMREDNLLGRRTDTQLAHSWSELRGPPQCERAKGAKGNGLLAIQYYGCCVVDSYHEDRTHLGLAKDTPAGRPAEIRSGCERKIQSFPRLGGLHHRYAVAA